MKYASLFILQFVISVIFIRGVHAQSISYTIDSTCFNALTLEGGMTQARFADLNQDGHPDIVSVGDHGSPLLNTNEQGITVFFGNGTGTSWTLFQTGDFGYGGIAVGDLNNDRKPDVAYSMHHNFGLTDFGDQLIEAALNDGSGTSWFPWDDLLGTNGEYYGMFGTDVGDIDNDGLLDIGSNSFGLGPGMHIYKNLGTGSWQQTFSAGSGGTTGKYMQFGDINHDGNLDFVASNEFGSPYFGNGAGSFTLHQTAALPALVNQDNYNDLSLDDIDNDGDDDFAFTYNHGIYVFKWDDATQLWIDCSAGLPLPAADYYLCARLGDLDMDGFSDLVTLSYNNQNLQVWKGNGGTSWTSMQNYNLPDMNSFSDLAIADIDHSGYPDLLLWAGFTTGLFTHINKLWLFKEDSVPSALNISQIYPRGFECFPNNAVRFVRWSCAVPGNHASTVSIELSTSGNSGPWAMVEPAAPNNGTYQWTVPTAINSDSCYFRLIAIDSLTSFTDTVIITNPFTIGICNLSSGISENRKLNNVMLAPNPFHISTNIYSSLKEGSVSVFDVTGNVVRTISNAQFPFVLQRGNLSPGLYFVEIKTGNGKIERAKMIVF